LGERLNGIQEVVGSIPISSTNRKHFRKNKLASALPTGGLGRNGEVSNCASNASPNIVSTHSEKASRAASILASGVTHELEESHLARRDRREPRHQTQTIAKWEREGKFPAAKAYLSDRLILYDREEVRRTLDLRKALRRRRMLPRGDGR
jgi:hypothetical protein